MKAGKKLALVLASTTLAAALPVHAAALIGDLNGDGVVDSADAKKLAEYFAGYRHEIDPVAADVDIDGDVDRKDGMILSRYADGWDGYEMPTEEEAATAIYTKELDEEHIQTGTLTYEGETYEGMYVDNEIIIVVDEDVVGREYVEELVEPYGGTVVGQVPSVGFYQVLLTETIGVEELETIIVKLMLCEYVEDAYLNTVTEYETNAYYPNDPFDCIDTYKEYYLWNTSSYTWHLRAINVPEAWELVYSVNDDPHIKVGVLDGLFDDNHEDLSNLTIQHYASNGATVQKYPDEAAHGTHVAGIIGADVNNGRGIAGVALNAEMICRTVTKNTVFHTTIAKWVSDLSALIMSDCNIINMSLGTNSEMGKEKNANELEEILLDHIQDGKKFLLVTTAGNDGHENHDVNNNNILTRIDKSALVDRIIVVGNANYCNGNYRDFSDGFERYLGVNLDGSNSEYAIGEDASSYIGNRVDIMAPGTKVFSTIPSNATQDSNSIKNGYGRKTGTSMAAPVVAGVAALVMEANPELTPEEVKY
ncbi:MAG: S8 family serine peptidase, partial [Clostridia bacterium]|nr:S8 family serine peptidase [Clostridia bacterium]